MNRVGRHQVGGRQTGRRLIGRCRARSCATRMAHATRPACAARGEREDAMLDRPSLPISEIVQIAANSALARVSWDGGRGRAPLGYSKGMAVMFAVALRKLSQGDPAAVEMARASSGDPSRDALAYYASEFARLGM